MTYTLTINADGQAVLNDRTLTTLLTLGYDTQYGKHLRYVPVANPDIRTLLQDARYVADLLNATVVIASVTLYPTTPAPTRRPHRSHSTT